MTGRCVSSVPGIGSLVHVDTASADAVRYGAWRARPYMLRRTPPALDDDATVERGPGRKSC
jgi:hypothetical protein